MIDFRGHIRYYQLLLVSFSEHSQSRFTGERIDRGNEKVAYLYDPLHPAVLRTIQSVIQIAHRQGIWVSMCGEMAADPLCTLILLGMKIDELSMNAVAMPTIKKIIRSVRLEEAINITYKVMSFSTSVEIKEYITNEMTKRFPELFSETLYP